MTSKPEFPRPSAGDELILYRPPGRNQEEQKFPVRVKAMARFKVTLEGLEGEGLPWWQVEFDVRTQRVWDRRYAYQTYELHTPETLAYKLKVKAVNAFFAEHEIMTYRFRGALRKKIDEDPLAFVNLLKEWAGEETI